MRFDLEYLIHHMDHAINAIYRLNRSYAHRFEDMRFNVEDKIRTAFWRMISKIWYRHVVTLTCDMMRELPDSSVRMWFADRPKNSITWATGTYHGWPAVEWHVAFHRIEDAVMFKMRAL